MYPKTNILLNKVRGGNSCSCLKINLSDPRIIEICGLSGFDAVWLCGEHVCNDWLNLDNQIRAAQLHGMETLVRVAKGSYSDFIKPLEAGAGGIIVPNVRTAAEAASIIEMVRFRPYGYRALDGGSRDGAYATIPTKDYLEYSNENQIVALQIESPEGLENVEAIARVKGFQFLFFGPGDFAHQSGFPGELNHPEHVKARERVEEVAQEHGKYLMSINVDVEALPQGPPRCYVIGADVVAFGERCRSLQDAFSINAEKNTMELHGSKRPRFCPLDKSP